MVNDDEWWEILGWFGHDESSSWESGSPPTPTSATMLNDFSQKFNRRPDSHNDTLRNFDAAACCERATSRKTQREDASDGPRDI